jgi:1,4-alpha-glucan branching enzyme
MHDTLAYFANDPLFRKFHHHQLTFRMMYAWSESFCLPLSHDEVVHGKGSLLAKMPGDDWQKRANLRLLLGFQWCQPGKKLLFMGCEFGQWREWAHEEELDWALAAEPAHAGLQRWVADLNRAYRSLPALHQLDCDPEGFYWLVANDADLSVAAFLRRPREGGAPAVCAFNFTPMPRHGYRLGVPSGGHWREVVNGDAPEYGGSGQGNYGGVEAVPEALHGQSHSVVVTLPPLAALILTLDTGRPATGEPAA